MLENKMIYLQSILKEGESVSGIFAKDPYLRRVNQVDADRYVKALNCRVITILSKNYPDGLKLLPAPPWVIFYVGDLRLLQLEIVAIISCDTPTKYGMAATRDIVAKVDKTKVIMCDGSKGICMQAITSALLHKIPVILMVDGEVDIKSNLLYQMMLAKNLFISLSMEHMNVIKDQVDSLQMGIAKDVIIVEGDQSSRTLNKIALAIKNGLTIHALPGNIYAENSQVCNQVIKDGAKVIYLGVEI